MMMGGGKKNMVVRDWVEDDASGDVFFGLREVILKYLLNNASNVQSWHK
jgi:hypothetical protein